MTSLLNYIRMAGACALAAAISTTPVLAQVPEPTMAEYTHYPLFQTGSIAPRIMIILDNSGSMNYPAYNDGIEEMPEGRTIEAPYKGGTCQQWSGRVNSGFDDGMEQKNTGEIFNCAGINLITSFDIDLGRDDDFYGGNMCNKSCACHESVISAVRFVDVDIPKQVDGVPVKIISAYIEFTARAANEKKWDDAMTLKITAQAADDPPTLSSPDKNISNRPDTAAYVTWDVASGEWTAEATYSSVDIGPIVQELIDRPGWKAGNAMLFKIDPGTASEGRTTYSFEANALKAPRLVIEYEPCEVSRYYGYFDPDSKYTYSGNIFMRDPSGPWDGNFLNFVTMRRGDVLRKAVVGGLSTSRTGGGNPTQIGISSPPEYAAFRRHHAGNGVSPWNDAWYFVDDGNLYVRPSKEWTSSTLGTFKIEVEKDPIAEPHDFGDDGELAGVFQKVGDRAQWGNAWFTKGDVYDGKAEINYPIGSNMTNMVTTIKNKAFETSTPISEALYVVTQYFKQEDTEISGYANGAVGPFNDVNDPYINKNGEEEDCAKAFCLLLTDGMSTDDRVIPEYLRGYDKENLPIEYFDLNGSSYARDVALYMHTTDLRSDTVGINAMDGTQNIDLFVVFALGDSDEAKDLLHQAAINGGFTDSNGNKLPDKQSEWDEDGDGVADNYFEAEDGYKLEAELMEAILNMLQRAGSGTAVSVLATKGEGEGTLVQAIFNPALDTDYGQVKWTGMLHSLWVDDHGQMREDTVADYALNTDEDQKIKFDFNDEFEKTIFWRYPPGSDEPYPDYSDLDDLSPIWAGDKTLAERDPVFRKIYTYIGDRTESWPTINCLQVNYDFFNMLKAMKFLGIHDNTAWAYLGADEISRAINLMLWTSGVPDADSSYYGTVTLRNRTDSEGRLLKLGDIIHSTPTSVAQPLSDYDLLYSDESYYEYYTKYKNRETIVFVGSNSGMLHVFTGWAYDSETQGFVNPYDIPDYFTIHGPDNTAGDVEIGSELWSFIPQAVLPHLKWMADPKYTHVNTMDLRPRVFDAKIFRDSSLHPGGWGTILVCGMGFAASMEIPVNPNHPHPANRMTMHPTFFAIDITNPRSPYFLWERTFPDLGMSSNYPSLMKVEDNWFLAIGSGPTTVEGTSKHDASLIIVDLKTGGATTYGGLKQIFTLPGGNAFANEPVVFDKNMNYNTDSVYVAANYADDTSQVFRLTIPQKDAKKFTPFDTDGNAPEYVDDPASKEWTITKLFKSPRPITASGSLSVDRKDNAWLYVGTGRYLSQSDKTTDNQNYIIGIKDPFFNPDLDDCNYEYPAAECEINSLMSEQNPLNDLFDADEYTVYGRSEVEGPEGKVTFDDMVTEARRNVYQGWYRRLLRTVGEPSERVINKGAVLGGILLKPTFMPNGDPCGWGGSSRLFAVYYETGTAFFRKVFAQDTGEGPVMDIIDLGDGVASSLSMHSGRQSGGKVYVQKSTGEILEVDVDPAFNIKTGPEYWLDDGYY